MGHGHWSWSHGFTIFTNNQPEPFFSSNQLYIVSDHLATVQLCNGLRQNGSLVVLASSCGQWLAVQWCSDSKRNIITNCLDLDDLDDLAGPDLIWNNVFILYSHLLLLLRILIEYNSFLVIPMSLLLRITIHCPLSKCCFFLCGILILCVSFKALWLDPWSRHPSGHNLMNPMLWCRTSKFGKQVALAQSQLWQFHAFQCHVVR